MFYLLHRVHSPLPFYLESEHKVQFPVSLDNSVDNGNSHAGHVIIWSQESVTLLCFLVSFLWNTQLGSLLLDRQTSRDLIFLC